MGERVDETQRRVTIGRCDSRAPTDEEERLARFRIALMLAMRRDECFCGSSKAHAGWVRCVEAEAERSFGATDATATPETNAPSSEARRV